MIAAGERLNNIRAILVNPPGEQPQTREGRCTQSGGIWRTTWPPLTLAYLGALLRQAGATVRIIDCAVCCTSLQELLVEVKAFRPDIAIWPVGNVTPELDLGVATALRTVIPSTRTAIIGTFPAALPEDCFNRQPDLDAIFLGEPEDCIVEAAHALVHSVPRPDMPGVWFRKNPRPTSTLVRTDLSALPFPDWGLVGALQYRLPLSGRPFLMAAPSRGCPFDCSFCTSAAYHGKRVRKRDPVHFVDELDRNTRDYGVRDFFFWSDTFTVDRNQVLGICEELLRRRLKIRWTCNSRGDTLDADLARMMRRAGCWMVSFGVESGDQGILDRSGKRISIEKIRSAIEMTGRSGIQTSGHFVLGLPGETARTARATITMAHALPLDWIQFYGAAPWPGSRLFADAVSQGLLTVDDVWKGISQTHVRHSLCELSPEELNGLLAEANGMMYRRARTWWAALRQARPSGLLRLLR
ncbi:MAG TPA: radical SAM protein [Candidatus Hydrogenedentes bacterium]|nr:radical SAM protein [Candidatus Hydrogenedentota bacterium]HPC15268.1 radical SAM protein [Candidatus Hydrogenedentota bacterium]HRT19223.1 radical SAM protein [Candidatus Hydrogenedentota bacterium]HRT63303.1 radical SAM protein [Candidatus Hydrogenedentota bacterium]